MRKQSLCRIPSFFIIIFWPSKYQSCSVAQHQSHRPKCLPFRFSKLSLRKFIIPKKRIRHEFILRKLCLFLRKLVHHFGNFTQMCLDTQFGPSWMKTTVSFVPDLSPNYSSCVDFSLVESSFEFFDPKPLYLQIHCPIAMANIANIEIIALGKTPMPVARRTPQRIMGMPMYSTLLATRFLMKSLYPKQLCK